MAQANVGGEEGFDVNSEDEEGYKSFIDKIIEEFGKENAYGKDNPDFRFRVLPNVHDTKVFTKKLFGNKDRGDTPVHLVFKIKNVYYIAWGVGEDPDAETTKWFVLKEHHKDFKDLTDQESAVMRETELMKKKKHKGHKEVSRSDSDSADLLSDYLVRKLAKKAKVMEIDSNYSQLCTIAGAREKLQLGKYSLRKAIHHLSTAENERVDKKFSKSCLMIMQMISEPARYGPLLDFIHSWYETGRCPEIDLVNMQNDWGKKSENLGKVIRVVGGLTREQLKVLSENLPRIVELIDKRNEWSENSKELQDVLKVVSVLKREELATLSENWTLILDV